MTAEVLDTAEPEIGIDEAFDRIAVLADELDGLRARDAAIRTEIVQLRLHASRALARRQQEVPSLPVHSFSDAEARLLPYLTSPQTCAEIARELYVSVNTVKTHLKNIYRKLGVGDRRAAAAALAVRPVPDRSTS